MTTAARTAPTTKATTSHANPLPKILNIRYKLIEPHTLEFYWSLPFSYNRELINGYQISVVPKDIPGVDSSSSAFLFPTSRSGDGESGSGALGGYFGSVGAIVGRDQHSFVVRQLQPGVRYIFQIVAIGVDGQSAGPPSSIEFRLSHIKTLNDESNGGDSSSSSSEARLIDSRPTSTNDYDLYLNSAFDYRFSVLTNLIILLAVALVVFII